MQGSLTKYGNCAEEKWRPQPDLNRRRRRERAVSWTRLDDGDESGDLKLREPCWARTSDPRLKRALLYQLS